MANLTFPVPIQTMVVKKPPSTEIYYPQLFGLSNKTVQHLINETIRKFTEELMQTQYVKQEFNNFDQMIGTYEIKNNQRNILSLTLSNYAIGYQAANGLTLMDSLTFDVNTGENYQLKDLFKQGVDYITILSNMIRKQIAKRDIPIIGDFESIEANQCFYIADKCLVLYFQEIEITPHYIGIPVFPISVFNLQDIILEDGPLGRMMASV